MAPSPGRSSILLDHHPGVFELDSEVMPRPAKIQRRGNYEGDDDDNNVGYLMSNQPETIENVSFETESSIGEEEAGNNPGGIVTSKVPRMASLYSIEDSRDDMNDDNNGGATTINNQGAATVPGELNWDELSKIEVLKPHIEAYRKAINEQEDAEKRLTAFNQELQCWVQGHQIAQEVQGEYQQKLDAVKNEIKRELVKTENLRNLMTTTLEETLRAMQHLESLHAHIEGSRTARIEGIAPCPPSGDSTGE